MDSALIGPSNLIDALREKRVLGYRRARIPAAPEMKLHGLPGVILYEIAPGPELMRVDSRLLVGGSGRAAGLPACCPGGGQAAHRPGSAQGAAVHGRAVWRGRIADARSRARCGCHRSAGLG